jgi:polyisoprenoid-binding protein YceI
MIKRITLGILVTGIAAVSVSLAVSRVFVVPADAQFDAQRVFTIESNTSIENFTGRTSKVTGSVQFDAEGKTGSANIIVDGASIDTGVALRNEHMRSAGWFNFDKNPSVKFVTTSIKNISGDKYRVVGNLTLNGVTKSVSSSANVRLNKASDTTKRMGYAGDVLAIVAQFKIKVSDYGVKNPAIDGGQVSNDLNATLRFVASAQ